MLEAILMSLRDPTFYSGLSFLVQNSVVVNRYQSSRTRPDTRESNTTEQPLIYVLFGR